MYSTSDKETAQLLIELLIQTGVNVYSMDDNGFTPHRAVRCRNDETVELLLEKNANLAIQNSFGQTALPTVIHHHEAISCILIEQEKGLEIVDGEGNTPLHLPAWHGRETAMKILPDKNVDSTVQNNDEKTALYLTIERRHEEIGCLLIEQEQSLEIRDGK